MSPSNLPPSLADLLKALEKSDNLRSLARDCGLSVREFRRRLSQWRKEVQADESARSAGPVTGEEAAPETGKDAAPAPARSGGRAAKAAEWPDLPDAAELDSSPLPRKGSRVLEVWTDGASKGNPGPASIGIVFGQRGGPALCAHAETIGRATNNMAEYRAVVRALEICKNWRVKRVAMFMDSELIARQVTGVYRVKSLDLRPLYQQVIFLSRELESFQVRYIPREQNRHADYLANLALRKARS